MQQSWRDSARVLTRCQAPLGAGYPSSKPVLDGLSELGAAFGVRGARLPSLEAPRKILCYPLIASPRALGARQYSSIASIGVAYCTIVATLGRVAMKAMIRIIVAVVIAIAFCAMVMSWMIAASRADNESTPRLSSIRPTPYPTRRRQVQRERARRRRRLTRSPFSRDVRQRDG